MNRKTIFIIMLCVYAIVGIAAILLFHTSGVDISLGLPGKSSTLSAPVTVDKNKEESLDSAESASDNDGTSVAEDDTSSDISDEERFEGMETVEELFSDVTPTVAPEDEKQYTFKAIHGSGRLFIRDTPSLEGHIVGHLRNGQEGTVIDKGDEWAKIKYKDIEGYVFKEHIELIPVE